MCRLDKNSCMYARLQFRRGDDDGDDEDDLPAKELRRGIV